MSGDGSDKFPVKSLYTSCACNRAPSCLDWGYNGLIVYGACNSVAVYEPKEIGGKIIQTLVCHEKLVTSVHWIHRQNEHETELISTSADKTAVVWSLHDEKFMASHVLKGHTSVVKTATAAYSGNTLLIITASADSNAKVWKREDSVVECIQTISYGNGFALDVKLSFLSDDADPVLAVGRDDFKIHLYVWNSASQFVPCAVLSGHEDWIQGIDMIREKNGTLWLASGSQDTFVRVWKVFPKGTDNVYTTPVDLKVQEITFESYGGQTYLIRLESVLAGHDNWVYSVRWGPYKSEASFESFRLLSSSMDRTMIIWQPDCDGSIWMDEVRVGEIGGNVLGFYGGVFSPDGLKILAHGYQGEMHIWSYDEESDFWNPTTPFGGHFAPVQDIDWEPDGAYVLSCSLDQTTRLHAPLFRGGKKRTWHELARPQIHGYDVICLSVLNRYKYVSGSDEKVLRVFQAPKSFADNLESLAGIDTTSYVRDALPEGASVPALGLSNKAVYEKDLIRAQMSENDLRHPKDRYPEFTYSPVALTDPPTEEILLQSTLWPENLKLYGHPYEIFSIASNHKGTVLASSCKAAKAEHAAIILWSTETWKKLGHLVFHSLSITQMEFSPDDSYLLSVSRDRMWALYQHAPDESPPYKLVAHLDKKSGIHTRIIWSCSWAHDSMYFATASRDKKVAVWDVSGSTKITDSSLQVPCKSQLDVEDSATAVAFAPCFAENMRYIIAVGLDNGKIFVYTWGSCKECPDSWNLHCCLDRNFAHHLTVNRLKFSPVKVAQEFSEITSESLLLASCGSDFHVKINAVQVAALL